MIPAFRYVKSLRENRVELLCVGLGGGTVQGGQWEGEAGHGPGGWGVLGVSGRLIMGSVQADTEFREKRLLAV